MSELPDFPWADLAVEQPDGYDDKAESMLALIFAMIFQSGGEIKIEAEWLLVARSIINTQTGIWNFEHDEDGTLRLFLEDRLREGLDDMYEIARRARVIG